MAATPYNPGMFERAKQWPYLLQPFDYYPRQKVESPYGQGLGGMMPAMGVSGPATNKAPAPDDISRVETAEQRLAGAILMLQVLGDELESLKELVVQSRDGDTRHHPDGDGQPGEAQAFSPEAQEAPPSGVSRR